MSNPNPNTNLNIPSWYLELVILKVSNLAVCCYRSLAQNILCSQHCGHNVVNKVSDYSSIKGISVIPTSKAPLSLALYGLKTGALFAVRCRYELHQLRSLQTLVYPTFAITFCSVIVCSTKQCFLRVHYFFYSVVPDFSKPLLKRLSFTRWNGLNNS